MLRNKRSSGSSSPINVLVACSHIPDKDPRVSWLIDTTDKSFCMNALGIGTGQAFIRETVTQGKVWTTAPLHNDSLEKLVMRYGPNNPGLSALSLLQCLDRLSDDAIRKEVNFNASGRRISSFRWMLGYIYRTSISLLDAALKIKGLHCVICVDLDTLPGMIALGAILNIPVILDAHEYWPDSGSESENWERVFWRNFQDSLVPHLAGIATVSPYLATMYKHNEVLCIPNATSLIRQPEPSLKKSDRDLVFLFQGGFAAGRGLLDLVSNWKGLPQQAKLHLRGPRNSYYEIVEAHAQKLGLRNKTVFFPESVTESELISAAANADVGLIPYESYSKTYSNCSPNKFSQYMAAGKAVLSNELEYISSLIDEHNLGYHVDFREKEKFQSLILHILNNRNELRERSNNARRFFQEDYHWEKVAHPLYEMIKSSAKKDASHGGCELIIDMGLDSDTSDKNNLIAPATVRSEQKHNVYMHIDSMRIPYATLIRYTYYRTLRGLRNLTPLKYPVVRLYLVLERCLRKLGVERKS